MNCSTGVWKLPYHTITDSESSQQASIQDVVQLSTRIAIIDLQIITRLLKFDTTTSADAGCASYANTSQVHFTVGIITSVGVRSLYSIPRGIGLMQYFRCLC